MTGESAAIGPNRRWRRLQLAVGLALTAISFGFLLRYGFHHRADLTVPGGVAIIGPWVVAAVAIYAAALEATAVGWVFASRMFGANLDASRLAAIGLVSQIGKYAPGNVAQHVSRIALAKSQGVPVTLAAKATATEIPSAILAGAFVAAVATLCGPTALSSVLAQVAPDQSSPLLARYLAGAAIASIAIGLAILRWRLGATGWVRAGLGMFGAHCASAALAALSFYAMGRAMVGSSIGLTDGVFAFSVAWLAGFVTPGAPAGLGVREAVLLLSLPQVGPMALVVAVGHRLATAVADALMAVVGAAMLRPKRVGAGTSRSNGAVR